ncbi:hypothetical protein TGMAS_253810 [Toxoplasma gondii MAS]|uniref:Uncharacterized protein n=2 Tax=Toxoplasma gondii TaxID=5811 RepID=A0A086QQT2_TOXGO|nr:hypothetical protein TGMAS_253810 [Toxoplasma gondii MAS]PUA89064.1 hypothetical protein TGBR9_253810 [Toxoplasma gondii TgCATBr9]
MESEEQLRCRPPPGGEPPAKVADVRVSGDCASISSPCSLEISYELLLFSLQSCTDPGIQTRQEKLAATTAAVRESLEASLQDRLPAALTGGLKEGPKKGGEIREAVSSQPSISASQIPPPQVASAALAVSLPIYGGAVDPCSRGGGSGGKASERQPAFSCLVKTLPSPSAFSPRSQYPWVPSPAASHADKDACRQSLTVRYVLPVSAPESGDPGGERQREERENSGEGSSSRVARGSAFLGRKQKSVLRLKNQVVSGVHCRLHWSIDTDRLVALTEAVLAASKCASGGSGTLPLASAVSCHETVGSDAKNGQQHTAFPCPSGGAPFAGGSQQSGAADRGGAPRHAWGHFLVFDAEDSDLLGTEQLGPPTAGDQSDSQAPAASCFGSSALPGTAAILRPQSDPRVAAFWRPQLTSLLTRTNLAQAMVSLAAEGRKRREDTGATDEGRSPSEDEEQLSVAAVLDTVEKFPFVELQVADESTNGTWIGGKKLQKQQGASVWPGKATLALSKQYVPSEQPVAAFRWALSIKWRRIQTSTSLLSPSSSSSASLSSARSAGCSPAVVEPMGGGPGGSPAFSLSSRTDKHGESPLGYPPSVSSTSAFDPKGNSAQVLLSRDERATSRGQERPDCAAMEAERMQLRARSEGPTAQKMKEPHLSSLPNRVEPDARGASASCAPGGSVASTGTVEFQIQRAQTRGPDRERESERENCVVNGPFEANQKKDQDPRGTQEGQEVSGNLSLRPNSVTCSSLLATSAELLDLQFPSEDPPQGSSRSQSSSMAAAPVSASAASASAQALRRPAHASAVSLSAPTRAREGECGTEEREKKKMRLVGEAEETRDRDRLCSTPCESWSNDIGCSTRESGREKGAGRLAQQLQKLVKEKRELEDEIQQLLVENEELRNTEQQRQEEFTTLDRSLQEAREKWKAADATIGTLEERAAQREAEIEALRATARQQEERQQCREREWLEEANRLRAAAAALEEEKADLQDTLEEHKRVLARYTSICAAVREQLRDLSPRRSGPFQIQRRSAPGNLPPLAPSFSSPPTGSRPLASSSSPVPRTSAESTGRAAEPSSGAGPAQPLTAATRKGADNILRSNDEGSRRGVERTEDDAFQSQDRASLEDLLEDPPGPLTLLSPSRARPEQAACLRSTEKSPADWPVLSANSSSECLLRRGEPCAAALCSGARGGNGRLGLSRQAVSDGRDPSKAQSRSDEAEAERGKRGSEETLGDERARRLRGTPTSMSVAWNASREELRRTGGEPQDRRGQEERRSEDLTHVTGYATGVSEASALRDDLACNVNDDLLNFLQ